MDHTPYLILGSLTSSVWVQVGELVLAFALSAVIGLEREVRQKAAGLRTYTLVGTGAALFMIVSKYGFNDVLAHDLVRHDPARVAAGIVTGIGFIGAGLIFVRRDAVQGLTTAAIIWVTAAIGTAAGAGMWLVAVTATALHLVVVLVFPFFVHRLPRTSRTEVFIRVVYRLRRGILRDILTECTSQGFAVVGARTREDEADLERRRAVEVSLELEGSKPPTQLADSLHEIEGVLEVHAVDSSGDDY